MYRVIKCSVSSELLEEDPRYAEWQDRCIDAYNKEITSDQLEDMDYGQLVTFVADHADVAMNIASFFVDEFMRDEIDPLPLRASTR